jgi:hypothetical protein
VQELLATYLHGDAKYWCVGSGDGSLEAKVGSGIVALSLVLKEPYGFLLQYGMYDSTDDFVSITSTDFSTTVQASLGGNPWVVPTGFFVSREKAWEAIEDFCQSGQMSKSLTWGRLADQQWDSDY